MHWKTLKKILTHSEPPGYRQRKARPQQKLGPYQERIEPPQAFRQFPTAGGGGIGFRRREQQIPGDAVRLCRSALAAHDMQLVHEPRTVGHAR